MARTQVDSSQILDASITNADVSANAAIAFSKLAALSSANILIGNGSNVATAAAVSGDLTLSNAGAAAVVKLRGTDLAATAPTDQQVLRYVAANSRWEPSAASSGTITGSGTANTLTKWTSSSSIGDSLISESASKIGIGTVAPGELLSVGSNTFQVNSSGNLVKINGVVTSYPSSQGAADSLMFNDGSGNITWQRVVTSSGDVMVDDVSGEIMWM